jgi:hypothetical protein
VVVHERVPLKMIVIVNVENGELGEYVGAVMVQKYLIGLTRVLAAKLMQAMLWLLSTRFSSATVGNRRTSWNNCVWTWKDLIDMPSLTRINIAYLLGCIFLVSSSRPLGNAMLGW